MPVFYSINNLPPFNNAVITIGTFDGVHLGHQKILQEVVRHAQKINGESIVVTFEPHPRKLLFPNQELKILTPLNQKINLIKSTGIHHVVIAPFTEAFSKLSANEYIPDFLVKYFHPKSIVIGYDHHFGNDRKGNIALLKQYANEYGFLVFEIPAQLIDEAAVSSTKIRNAVADGNVNDVTDMIGRNYTMEGMVVKGAMLGRTIGFPTANIKPSDKDQLLPANGVYAVIITRKEKMYKAMLNIGFNPTVTESKTIKIEANFFDFDEDIYEETIEVIFIDRLRDEKKFDSLNDLKQQLLIDKENALEVLTSHN